jgi:hypothetical protein
VENIVDSIYYVRRKLKTKPQEKLFSIIMAVPRKWNKAAIRGIQEKSSVVLRSLIFP